MHHFTGAILAWNALSMANEQVLQLGIALEPLTELQQKVGAMGTEADQKACVKKKMTKSVSFI